MSPPTSDTLLRAVAEIFDLTPEASLDTPVPVDALTSLSLQAVAADRWGLCLDPSALEEMATLGDIVRYLAGSSPALLLTRH